MRMFKVIWQDFILHKIKLVFHQPVKRANCQILHMHCGLWMVHLWLKGSPLQCRILSVSMHSKVQPSCWTFTLCLNLRKLLGVHKSRERAWNIFFNICADLLITCNSYTSKFLFYIGAINIFITFNNQSCGY